MATFQTRIKILSIILKKKNNNNTQNTLDKAAELMKTKQFFTEEHPRILDMTAKFHRGSHN